MKRMWMLGVVVVGSLSLLAIGCGSSGGKGGDGTDGTDGADGKDGTPADGADAADAADAADGADATDGADGADATDGGDGTDGVDGTDGADATDGTGSSDGTDSADATDATDGTDVTLPPPDGSDGTDGDAPDNCGDAFTCGIQCANENCTAGDQGCILDCKETCEAGLSKEESDKLFAFGKCLAENCGGATTNDALVKCLTDKCPGETEACLSGSVGKGSDTCMQVVQCVNGCVDESGALDQACGAACLEEGSKDAIAQFNAVQACLQAECADAENQQACVMEVQQPGGACNDELKACQTGGAGKPGAAWQGLLSIKGQWWTLLPKHGWVR